MGRLVLGLASGLGAAQVGPALSALAMTAIKKAPTAAILLAEALMGPTGNRWC